VDHNELEDKKDMHSMRKWVSSKRQQRLSRDTGYWERPHWPGYAYRYIANNELPPVIDIDMMADVVKDDMPMREVTEPRSW
jgi:hypothetical protein